MSAPIERNCPTCGAEPSQRCIGKRGERKAFHRARGSRRGPQMVFTGLELPTESPIEKMLANMICAWVEHHSSPAKVTTQAAVGPFRADIMVEATDRKLVVECDGRDYHTSKDQVARDKRRDRYFVARGISVMRFTGAEINKDARGCAAEVGMWIRQA